MALRDRIAAASANASVIDFMVDCFRAAHRYVVIGLIAVAIAYAIGALLPAADPPEVRVRIQIIEPSAASAVRGRPGPVSGTTRSAGATWTIRPFRR
jgi:hypothetical protein